jgi:formate dehydrogenase maturation protein FdhE
MNKSIKDFIEAKYTEGGDEDTDLIVGTVLREYLRTLRKTNPGLAGQEGAENGACPFCGSHPKIAFDAETERRMFCPVCGNSWTFPRIKCPFCKNSDHNTLGYFEAEGIQGKRVYFCKECTYYFKVIDTNIRVALDAETENILSLELDHLAREEGFKESSI